MVEQVSIILFIFIGSCLECFWCKQVKGAEITKEFCLLGQPLPSLHICAVGGGRGLLARSGLAGLQPAEGYPQAVGQAPVSTSLYVEIIHKVKERKFLFSAIM